MTSPYASPVANNPVPGGDERGWWNSDPIAGFWNYLRLGGMSGLDPISQFAQRQYQPTYNKYQADAARDPTMGFYDYLEGNPDQFDYKKQYASLDPQTRGDTSGRAYDARARWITPR